MPLDPWVPDLDLGDDHSLIYTSWAPDRDLNPQYADLPDNPRIGAIIRHKKPDGHFHQCSLMFDCEQTRRGWPNHAQWQVDSWEPLTLSPSILCHCGDHGFIRNGTWVRA